MSRTPPIALTIAGSDPSGGAGIQADLKTFAALGVYGASVLTALTAQNTTGVFGVHAVPPDFIRAQFSAVMTDLEVRAIKTGMLADTATVETVVALIASATHVPVVVDPVMVATSGDPLLAPEAVAAVRETLVPRAFLITPNLHEAARLLDGRVASSESEMIEQARVLLVLGCKAVLVKGGHGDASEAIDVLADAAGITVHKRPRIETGNTHGTGCTLSAAIAAELANGSPLREAVASAKAYVWGALESASRMKLGCGSGPVDHGWLSRSRKR